MRPLLIFCLLVWVLAELCVFCRADVAIVRSNIDVLVKEGLGPRADDDFLLARDVCLVLNKLTGSKKVGF